MSSYVTVEAEIDLRYIESDDLINEVANRLPNSRFGFSDEQKDKLKCMLFSRNGLVGAKTLIDTQIIESIDRIYNKVPALKMLELLENIENNI